MKSVEVLSVSTQGRSVNELNQSLANRAVPIQFAISILFLVLVLATYICYRACREGKTGPQFGLSFRSKKPDNSTDI
ncbi:hypothetical protein BH10CYA1_BH10CYA1_48540 [soil metagenome]